MTVGKIRNLCIGSGERAVISPDGIGERCPSCEMLTIPHKNGTVRRHNVLGTPPFASRRRNPPCAQCGGPHPFDTSVPSVRWNAVIREAGLPDYLCLTCIVSAFVKAGESFTAELVGGEHSFEPIEIRTRGQHATDAAAIQRENNTLRARIEELETAPPGPSRLRALLEFWIHESRLQTFDDRERFRKEAREALGDGRA